MKFETANIEGVRVPFDATGHWLWIRRITSRAGSEWILNTALRAEASPKTRLMRSLSVSSSAERDSIATKRI